MIMSRLRRWAEGKGHRSGRPPGARPASSAGKDPVPGTRDRTGCLVRRRRTFPPRVSGVRKGLGVLLSCDEREITIQNQFLIPHNPAPWNQPSETHGLKEYGFWGFPDA